MKRRLFKYYYVFEALKPVKWLLILTVLLMLLRTALSVADPYLSKLIIDGITLRNRELSYILVLIGVYIMAIVARLILEIPISFIQTRFEKGLDYELKQQVLSKLFKMDYTKFEQYKSGDIISRVENDTSKIIRFVGDTSIGLAMDALWIVSVIVIMLRIEWKIATLSLVLTPLIPKLFKVMGPRIRETSSLVRKMKAEQLGIFTEASNGMLTLRLYNSYKAFADKLRRVSAMLINCESKLSMIRGIGPVVAESASALLSPGLIYGFGAYLIYTNQITIGDMLLFATYSTRLLSPLVSLTRIGFHYQEAIASADRLNELITAPCESGGHVDIRRRNVDIRFERVSYSYNNTPVINNIDLTIPFGSKMAIMGPSGTGKTTMAKMLVGLLKPSSGEILINDISTVSWKKDELRKMLTYVPQDTYLIADTIANNLRLGNPSASDEELLQALEMSCALGFVEALPNGIHEHILEGGNSLSGGQKQRIGLARALLRKSPVLILDEALGALDRDTEKLVLNNIKEYQGTVIFITHRDSVMQSMERYYVMKGGEIHAI